MIKLAQGNVMNNLRGWYKKNFDVPLLNIIVKKILRLSVNSIARLRGMEFPPKYDWDWKLEMLLGKYEKETTALVKKTIKPGMAILDIGAHIGYYTRLFSRLAGENGAVYAFEPEEENFKLLERNVKNLGNVKIIRKAAAGEDGFMDFYRAKNNTGHHSLISSEICREKTRVPAIALDSFIKKENIRRVDFIKIDIEGGEPIAFSGGQNLLSRPALKIVMEFTPENFKSKNEAVDFIKNLRGRFGFSINKIGEGGKTTEVIPGETALDEIMDMKESTNLFLEK